MSSEAVGRYIPNMTSISMVQPSDISINEENDETSASSSKVDGSEFDEVKEIRDHSKKDNQNVRISKISLVLILAAVGIAVTFTTYVFLKQDEVHSFETAFEQFSKTVSDSAERQQRNARDAFRSLAAVLTAHAQSTNATFPFVTFPFYEAYAQDFFVQSGMEITGFLPYIQKDFRGEYELFADQIYEGLMNEAHILFTGGLDRLKPVGYHPFISTADRENGGFKPDEEREFYFPTLHYSPPPFTYGIINWNFASIPDYANAIDAMFKLKNETIVTRVRSYAVSAGVAFTKEEHEAMHSKLQPGSSVEHPHSIFVHPVHETVRDYNSPIVGILTGGMALDASLRNLLPESVSGLLAVIKNDCDQQFTYEIDGADAIFLGDGDLHDPNYGRYEKIVNLALHTHPDFSSTPGHCQFSMYIYPTKTFESAYYSSVPVTYAIVVASTFALVAIVFFIYNSFVNRRNEKLVYNAAKSHAVIHALFPKNIRDRIMEDDQKQYHEANKKKKNAWAFKTAVVLEKSKEATFSSDVVVSPSDRNRPPLADYFPETTILFADISGFTAWSSVREPSQVFTLLETLYGAFDKLAKQSRVFKVETVGDCYVAATGIPDFHPQHAVHMVRFGRKIIAEMDIMTKKLEIMLGPDTGDLSLRAGIHSGPVTGGVLRGERARFQLFGDTMNTASRMEASSKEGRIQLSAETADLLRTSGKQHWLVKRKEPVKVKGKGDIQTYWVRAQYDNAPVHSTVKSTETQDTDSSSKEGGDILVRQPRLKDKDSAAEREARLVDWNVRMLIGFLKEIVARRTAAKGLDPTKNSNRDHQHAFDESMNDHAVLKMNEEYYPLTEVCEVIRLPEFDGKVAKLQKNHHVVEIPSEVEQQLHLYVTIIASMYRENNFHNFEHASHVTMSVIKLLSRIVAPTDLEDNPDYGRGASLRAKLHDHTYGITSDPLTQFACAFSALIHDVDHQGVPNVQLIKEHSNIASRFKDRSVAEQNSMVIAWNLLMEDRFRALRLCLCETPKELSRFRKLVINGVMATDITDKDLKNLRNARWEKAFKDPSLNGKNLVEEDVRDAIHRKATIVIEHLIQASDVAHTMQHWHVYRKWNENFFRECYAAYKAGRAETDPSEGWYKGEIGFFDFYIIPLAKKLDTCGVFGKSSDEYLNYALQNREEWKVRGEKVVADMVAAVEKECCTTTETSDVKEQPATRTVYKK